jgi:hypothetical protein
MVEHSRAEGLAGALHELHDSAHLYMLPLGLLLAALVACIGVTWLRVARELRRRLVLARSRLRRPRARAGAGPAEESVRLRSPGGRWLVLAVQLAVGQLVLYGVQENVERVAIGERVSVIHVFAGAHWGASLVQVAVAGVLAALVVACRRRFADLARRVDAIERLTDWLARARVIAGAPSTAAAARSLTPLERFGRRHLQRPPPRLRFGN